MPVEIGVLISHVNIHGLDWSDRAGIDALSAMDASVVVDDHLKAFFGFIDGRDLDRFRRTISLTGTARNAELRMEKRSPTEILGNSKFLVWVFNGCGFLEYVP